MSELETIAAIATPHGRGGVGVIRISGKDALIIAKQICGIKFKKRYAHYVDFKDVLDETIDSGLAIYFPNPASFTGEDVIELQGHGGPVIMQLLLRRVLSLGARPARPGEFSERAFLNDKLDLAQAEAIADLIDSHSTAAAKSAIRSLQGEFSKDVHSLLNTLIELRVYVESAIDFPEEEIDFLNDGVILGKIEALQLAIAEMRSKAGVGKLLQSGYKVALAGRPNAGKSSLLNTLSREEVAIVTDIEGTTRDSITVTIDLEGMPLHITDTAGLRDSQDKIEKIGIERARKIIAESDHVLLIIDATKEQDLEDILSKEGLLNLQEDKLSVIYNKLDLVKSKQGITPENKLFISAKRGLGIDLLKQHIREKAGYQTEDNNVYSARNRHIQAIDSASKAIENGKQQLITIQAGELLAEELYQAQQYLNTITGAFTPDDLLGEIFSNFCIGK